MSANKKCFVIFPFKKPYESRYEKIYKPALEDAGLQVVRANAPGVEVIIEDIEKKIRESFICFADLTADNANVWFEIGYAYACGKKVVMVCNTSKRPFSKLPFDINSRNVIGYLETIDKDDNARVGLGKKIFKDAGVKMKKTEKEMLAKKDAPVTPQNYTPSKNPLDEIVHDNLTKNDMDFLKEIVNYHIRNRNWGISESDLLEKNDCPPVLFSKAISKLLVGGYISQKNHVRHAGFAQREEVFSIFPTEKAMKLSREKLDLFL